MALIAHYPLNGDTKDYSGYVRVATHSVPVTYSDEGKIGKCRDSGNMTLPIGTMNSLEQSITFWLYNKEAISKTASSSQFMGGSSPRDYALFTYPNNNDLHWDFRQETGGTVFGGALSGVLENLKWTHVSIIKSPTNFKIYINGVLKTYKEYIGSISDTSIKPFPLLHNHQYIRINDIRIYDHALSDKEVKEIAKAKVLHYKFDEKDLTTKIVKDSSGFGNDGTVAVTTAPSWSEDSPVGRGSIGFNGAQEIDTQRTFNFGKEDYFTISVWVKPEDHSSKEAAAAGILGKGHWFDNTWDLLILNNNAVMFECSGATAMSGRVTVISPVMTINEWTNIIVVYNAGLISMYVNGVLYSTTTYNGNGGFTNPNRVYVGKRAGDNSRRFMGNISDVRIYATALTPEDILEIYQTRASVDNLGNLFVQEFDEVSAPAGKSIRSNGVAQFAELNEITSVDKMSIGHDGTLYVNEIKEA